MSKKNSLSCFVIVIILSFSNTQHLIDVNGLDAAPETIWSYFFPDIGQFGGPGVFDLTATTTGKIVVLSNLPSITCFNASTGDIVWELDPVEDLAQPLYTQVLQVAAADFNGDGRQEVVVAGGIPSGVTYEDPNVTTTGFLALLELEDGEVLWLVDNLNDTINSLLTGHFLNDAEIDIAVSHSTQLFLVDGATGMIHWQVQFGNVSTAQSGYLKRINNKQSEIDDILTWYMFRDVLFAVYDGNNGDVMWEEKLWPRVSGITECIVTEITGDAIDDVILSLGNRDGLFAYDGQTKSLLWEVIGLATDY